MNAFRTCCNFFPAIVILLFAWQATNCAGQLKDLGTRKPGVDWPTFLGPTGDGKSSETGILTDWSGGKLKPLWKIKTGEGYGMGSVAKGRFFHFGRLNNKATLLCLNSETGKQLWDFSYDSKYRDLYGYDSGPRTSPVIDGDRVYIYGVEGMLHGLNAADGKVIWKLNLNERFGVIQNFFGVSSTPVIFEDLIIVMVGGSPDESKKAPPGALDQVKPNDSGILAFDKFTGELKYKVVNDLASYCSLKLANLNDQPTLLAWMRGSVYGLNPANGKAKFDFPWRSRKLESVNASMPVVIEKDKVFISECYEIGSALLKVGDGSVDSLWTDRGKRAKALEAHWNTPIVIGDSVFGCSGRHTAQAELRCIDWTTGKIRWEEDGLSRTSLTYIDGHFVVLGEMGDLLLIKASSTSFELVTKYDPGDDNDSIKFRSPCWAAPIISHGLMYVRGKDQLICFDLIPD